MKGDFPGTGGLCYCVLSWLKTLCEVGWNCFAQCVDVNDEDKSKGCSFLSVYTVETHRKNILQKLGLKSSVSLMKFIMENYI